MKVIVQLIGLIVILSYTSISQESSVRNTWEFMPRGSHFVPLLGNPQESRIAVAKTMRGPDLHVDIGNNIDIVRLTIQDGSNTRTLSAGITFFAYAYVTSIADRRLKVDAMDGFFGGYITYSSVFLKYPWDVRLRIIHHSAHMVDGRFDPDNQWWVDDKLPISFTRDHFELTTTLSFDRLRIGAGFGAAWLHRPPDVSPVFSFLYGDYRLLSSEANTRHLYVAYYSRIEKTDNPFAVNTITGGIKFGEWEGRGVRLILQYYSGYNFFAEYYNEWMAFGSIGFSVDFR